MFLRILGDSFLRRKRRKGIILAAVALGTAGAAALADIALDVGDRMRRELDAFGANLVILPAGGAAPVVVAGQQAALPRLPAFLPASSLPAVTENFWKNNILAYAPELEVAARLDGRPVVLRGAWFERLAGGVPAGVRSLNPLWSVDGRWPDDRRSVPAEMVVGRVLAERAGILPGAVLELRVGDRAVSLPVVGIVTTGGEEDTAVLAPIETVWDLSGLRDRVSRVAVRALTTPESAVYARLGTNPQDLPPAEFERWTCTPFPSSIAWTLERALPGSEVRVVRRVAEAEGAILRRTSGLMAFIAVLAAAGAALTVTSALSTSVLERRSEIGLLKALGAGNARVVGLFLAEAAVLGFLGGAAGAGLGAVLARFVSASVFGAPVAIRPMAVPLAIALALLITLAGSIVPARRILAYRPFEVLRGL